ncbi:MAG: DoxX family protein, partial [Candidatus Magnetoovum sp. WYHC-5]|nr:DoxX family protein [Candidatus Magnetoovum sp. WYHC-5]
MFRASLKTQRSIPLMIIRLALGVVIFIHGVNMVFNTGIGATIDKFTASGFIVLVPFLVIITEFICPILMFVGFATRYCALLIGVVIASCAYFNHMQHGFFMNWTKNQSGEGYEYHTPNRHGVPGRATPCLP